MKKTFAFLKQKALSLRIYKCNTNGRKQKTKLRVMKNL